MIKAIEMTREDMEEIVKHMPEHLKEKIFSMIRPDSGIDIVKQFVEQYEDDNMMDHILAHTVSTLLKKITSIAKSVSKDRKREGGESLSTIDIAMITSECLKDESKNILKALNEHEKECTQGNKCGAKH